jgi:predicted ATPase
METSSNCEGRLTFPQDFYGRLHELSELQGIVARVDALETSATVLIAGGRGTGKSRLVRRFREDLEEAKEKSYFFVEGKSDEFLSNNPFSLIIGALNELCEQILAVKDYDRSDLRTRIQDAVGSESKALTDVLPKIAFLFTEPSIVGSTHFTSVTGINPRSAVTSFKFLFQRFLKAVCTKQRPVIIFLDDLQWIDAASLELLTHLLTLNLPYFVFIGAYRDNKVEYEDEHPLRDALSGIIASGHTYHTMNLGNLSVDDVNHFVAETLKLEAEITFDLTSAIYERTQGNIVYTMASLEILQRERVLTFNLESNSWAWNLETVETEINYENIVAVVVAKLQTLCSRLQTTLSTAAFLPSTFDAEMLACLVQQSKADANEPTKSLINTLDVAVAEGLLENVAGTTKYRFLHDLTRQAAILLVAGEEKDKMRLKIGLGLLQLYDSSPSTQDWIIFAAADHLNMVPDFYFRREDSLMIDPCLVVILNCRVGAKASAMSAYVLALKYLRKGIATMAHCNQRWKTNYDLTLKLYRSAADVEMFIGNFDRGHNLAREIFSNARTFEEKIPVYISLAEGLGQQKQQRDSIDVFRKILQYYGANPSDCTVAINAVTQLLKTKWMLHKMTDAEILNLPLLQDKKKLIIMETLSRLGSRASACGAKFLALWSIMRQIRISLKHGLCPSSAFGLSVYSAFLYGRLDDPVGGRRAANLALKVSERCNSKEFECRILLFTAS